jgi:hypothetical protein
LRDPTSVGLMQGQQVTFVVLSVSDPVSLPI